MRGPHFTAIIETECVTCTLERTQIWKLHNNYYAVKLSTIIIRVVLCELTIKLI